MITSNKYLSLCPTLLRENRVSFLIIIIIIMALVYSSISQKRLALGHAPGKINGQINLETLHHIVCLLKIHNEVKIV